MTTKIYTTAQGKSIDLGTIALKNEHVRAVGNMNVNARGDILDSAKNIIETKPQLIQRQNSRLTNVTADPVQTSQRASKKSRPQTPAQSTESVAVPTPVAEPVEQITPLSAPPAQDLHVSDAEGLAGAIARSRQIKQELDKTRRQQQTPGVRKI